MTTSDTYTYYIYKIVCNDTSVTDLYVGSGKKKASRQRRFQHKLICNDETNKNHNIKIYKIIRQHGGWDNWRMVIIEEMINCSKIQARIKEEEHRLNLNANMNTNRAYSPPVIKCRKNKKRDTTTKNKKRDTTTTTVDKNCILTVEQLEKRDRRREQQRRASKKYRDKQRHLMNNN